MSEFGREGHLSRSRNAHTPAETVEPELSSGERLVWADRPISPGQHAWAAIPTALFGIPFLAFAIFWTLTATTLIWGSGQRDVFVLDYLFPLFGSFFILVGLSLILSPLWKAYKATGMIYALTNQRLIIRESRPVYKINSWSLDQVERLSRTGPPEGPGSLFFAEEIVDRRRSLQIGFGNRKIGFRGIDQPKRLEDEIRALLKKE